MVESDSKVAIQAFKGQINLPSDTSVFVKDIRVLASIGMDIQFLYCNREANTIVDDLAKKARCTIHPIWII